jgi:lipopolysaccharide/colanic/teichoic acid biosynthesis glycosyltransferase
MSARWYGPTKRCIDVICATGLLVVTAPAQIVVAASILVTMGRPIFFRQARAGLAGRPFTLVKFRTMRTGAGPDEERLTGLGKLLRAASLDELPSFWNVLKGEMSLVGPRPLYPAYLDRYTAEQARRHDVRPGITGLAQVAGRNALPWPQRLRLDVEYVDRCSFRLDLSILLQTVAVVIRRQGISEDGQATMRPFEGELR